MKKKAVPEGSPDGAEEEESEEQMMVVPVLRASGSGKPGKASGESSWIAHATGSSKIRSLGLKPSDVIEAALPDGKGTTWGARVLFRLRALDGVDSAQQGNFVLPNLLARKTKTLTTR